MKFPDSQTKEGSYCLYIGCFRSPAECGELSQNPLSVLITVWVIREDFHCKSHILSYLLRSFPALAVHRSVRYAGTSSGHLGKRVNWVPLEFLRRLGSEFFLHTYTCAHTHLQSRDWTHFSAYILIFCNKSKMHVNIIKIIVRLILFDGISNIDLEKQYRMSIIFHKLNMSMSMTITGVYFSSLSVFRYGWFVICGVWLRAAVALASAPHWLIHQHVP